MRLLFKPPKIQKVELSIKISLFEHCTPVCNLKFSLTTEQMSFCGQIFFCRFGKIFLFAQLFPGLQESDKLKKSIKRLGTSLMTAKAISIMSTPRRERGQAVSFQKIFFAMGILIQTLFNRR